MDRSAPLFNPHLSVRERAEWLVSQMTIEEKFTCFTLHFRNERLGIEASACGGEGAHGVQARAGQREAYPPTPTTSFTQPIGMAATFDRELICRAGDVTGKESRAFGNAVGNGGHSRLGPTVDLCRDPRWGRTEEGYGEDPYFGSIPGCWRRNASAPLRCERDCLFLRAGEGSRRSCARPAFL